MGRLRSRVPESDAGRRLDAFVAAIPEVGTRSLAERLVASGGVLVDGLARPKSYRLAGGEELEIEVPSPRELVPENVPLEVVLRDEHLLVVDKPAGVIVHPAGGHQSGTLAHGLLELGAAGGDPDRPGIVHRLDRDTSGLLVVARSDEAHTRLSAAIRERRVERRYVALVRGTPRSRTGRIEAPIGRDRRDRTRHSLDTETPRNAVTWFGVREQLGERTLLDLRLETGRTHQIRVHLEAIDLPVCGDPVYGIAGDLGLERQFLHANHLAFEHPFTQTRVEVESELPADLASAVERARDAA